MYCMAKMNEIEHNAIEEIIHFWLCEERRCVTIKSLTLEFESLTRQEAARLLERHVLKHCGSGYEITRCVMDKNDRGRLVLRLVNSFMDGINSINNDVKSSNIYSVSPLAKTSDEKKQIAVSSVQAAHEVDRVKERQVLLSREGSIQPLPFIIAPSLLLLEDATAATEAKENSLPAISQVGDHTQVVENAPRRTKDTAREQELPSMKSAKPIAAKNTAATTTTAANFFSSAATKKQRQDSSRLVDTATIERSKDIGAKETAAVMAGNKKACNALPPKTYNNKLIGNADDFVGDELSEEETSSYSQEGVSRTKATANTKSVTTSSSSENIQNDNDADGKSSRKQKREEKQENNVVASSAAINAFAGSQQEVKADDTTATAKRARHRQRKKYVEQTTMDENGYMHTETICVMEDILTDEEEEEVQQQQKSVGKKTMPKIGISISEASKVKQVVSNKKQMGLNAFFTTKKK